MSEEERKDADDFEECSCGHYRDTTKSQSAGVGDHHLPSSKTTTMDASFVHLPIHVHRHFGSSDDATTWNNKPPFVASFFANNASKCLETYQHLQELIRASQSGGDGAMLCADCISRVERALDTDSERLEKESIMYQQAARKEEDRLASLEKALRSVTMSLVMTNPYCDGSNTNSEASPNQGVQAAEQAFRDEIQALEEECRQQEAELAHLKSLKREQLEVSKKLSETEYILEVERNALELEARAFDNDQVQLYQMLQEIEDEVDQLSSDISLPSLLLDLQVDKDRGLRYPLINELRLAYRPKGDIKWNEIQVAWSLAAQLLLVVGTLFHYPSEEWKIVPLSHCAKLIFFSKQQSDDDKNRAGAGNASASSSQGRQKRAVVYHLGHPKTNGATAIRAWNQLLHQVILHVGHKTEEEYQKGSMVRPFPKLPYAISQSSVGTIDLYQLNENDDAGWSRAIHCMASNLLWLSECAALQTSQQVLWTSAVLQTCTA